MKMNRDLIVMVGSTAALLLETPCVRWTLHNEMLHDFSYERRSQFATESLSSALYRAGFAIRAIVMNPN